MLRRSPASVATSSPSSRRHADGTLPRHFAGSESGDRHRAEHVLELGGAVVSVLDRSGLKTSDYINRIVLTLPLSVYEGTWTTLSLLVAMPSR